ncbi:TonB family protein [Caulobacter mirabilis]|nr:TonB family protein [Caulobacter mirabilis]
MAASTLLHGGAAAIFLATATAPHGRPVAPTAPNAVTVDLISAAPATGAASQEAATVSEAAGGPSDAADTRPSGVAGSPDVASAASPGRSEPIQAAAPDPGAVSDYYRRLETHLARFHRYPETGLSPQPSGMVRVALIVRRDGHVMDAWIETSSGVVMLDEAALQTLRRAEPLPVLPASLPGAIDLIVPLKYATVTRSAG